MHAAKIIATFLEILKMLYKKNPISMAIAGKSNVKYACPGDEWRANEKRGNNNHT